MIKNKNRESGGRVKAPSLPPRFMTSGHDSREVHHLSRARVCADHSSTCWRCCIHRGRNRTDCPACCTTTSTGRFDGQLGERRVICVRSFTLLKSYGCGVKCGGGDLGAGKETFRVPRQLKLDGLAIRIVGRTGYNHKIRTPAVDATSPPTQDRTATPPACAAPNPPPPNPSRPARAHTLPRPG